MPRKTFFRRPPPSSDGHFSSVLVSRFISKMNFIGKKTKATKILYQALERVREQTKEDPLNVLSRAVENTRPLLQTKPRQVGGATYQVPCEVPTYRGESRAMRWIIHYARERKGAPMEMRLAEEILQASRKEGQAFRKKEEAHRMAEANRAFAHYRW